MKKHILMVVALFVVGCASTQEEEAFLERLGKCGESATISRVDINYVCSKLSCNASACGIKICNPDKFGGTISLSELEIDQGRCRAEFKAQQ